MDKKSIKDKLRALASDDKDRSKAARLRDVIDDVEAALAAGVARKKVVEALKANGLDIKQATFETTLKRIRKKRGKQPTSKREASPAKQTEEEKTVVGSHNPADLDEIIGSKPDLAALAKLAKRSKK